jgi:hypothetical protein
LPLSVWAQKTPLDSQKMRFEAMINRDTITLDRILGTDLTYLHSNGLLESKQNFINSISSGKLIYQEIKVDTPTLRTIGKISIVQNTGLFVGIIKGTPFKVRLTYLSIYKKEKRRWKLIAWQSLKTDA